MVNTTWLGKRVLCRRYVLAADRDRKLDRHASEGGEGQMPGIRLRLDRGADAAQVDGQPIARVNRPGVGTSLAPPGSRLRLSWRPCTGTRLIPPFLPSNHLHLRSIPRTGCDRKGSDGPTLLAGQIGQAPTHGGEVVGSGGTARTHLSEQRFQPRAEGVRLVGQGLATWAGGSACPGLGWNASRLQRRDRSPGDRRLAGGDGFHLVRLLRMGAHSVRTRRC